MRIHTFRMKASVVALVMLTSLAATAYAVTAPSSSNAPLPSSVPLPSQPLPAAEQQQIERKIRDAAAGPISPQASRLAKDFAVFRRSQRASDSGAPDEQRGDITRKVMASNGTDAYLIERGDRICIVASGGSACGLSNQATTKPLIFGSSRSDGSSTTMYMPVGDDVAEVQITSLSAATQTIVPRDNIITTTVDGPLRSVELTKTDGTQTSVIG